MSSNQLDVFELATMLKLDVDKETLRLCVRMIEEGANPEALVAFVSELERALPAGADG